MQSLNERYEACFHVLISVYVSFFEEAVNQILVARIEFLIFCYFYYYCNSSLDNVASNP